MSNNVDDRVVAMRFENSKFQQGVQATIGLLDKLKKSLNFEGANKGMQNVQDAANKFDMNHMGRAADAVSARFNAMRVVAYTVIANITNRAVNAGINIAKALTIDPIKAGFQNYEQQINALQTISNNVAQEFGNNAAKTTAAVTKELGMLNVYANKTIFDFKDMASAVGQFTAAGIHLKDASLDVQGVANAAALAGANTQQFAQVLPQLAQALSRGKVQAQDWMSVTNASLDSLKFKTAILDTAQAMGTLKVPAGQTLNVMKDFRPAMEAGAITSGVLSNALKVMSNTMTTAQYKAMGYSAAQTAALQRISSEAYASASNVRTFTALVDNVKQTMASNMASSFMFVIGDLKQSTALFTGISNGINNILQKSQDARTKMLEIWSEHGGRKTLLAGFKSALSDIGAIIKPIQQAFRDIFPATTGARLLEITHNFKDLMDRMKIGSGTAALLRETFRGLFAIMDIFHQVTKGVIQGVVAFFQALSGSGTSGGILSFTAHVGEMVTKFDDFLKKSGLITAVFRTIGQAVAVPVQIIMSLASAIGGLFSGFKGGGGASNLSDNMNSIATSTTNVGHSLQGVVDKVSPFIQKIHDFFQSLGHGIATAFSSGNFDNVNKALETGLFAGAILLVRKFLKDFKVVIFEGEGIINPIKKMFGGLTDSMKAMQTQLKAKALEEIAIAIGVLTASIVILSAINPGRLTTALTAMTIAFGELFAAMVVLIKLDPSGIKLGATAAALVVLAGAMTTLSVAIAIMGSMKMSTLAQGLGGIAASLAIMIGASALITKLGPGLISGAVGIGVLAAAMITLALAIKLMATIKWSEMGRGLTATAASLGIMIGALRLMPAEGMVASAVALGILSVALIGLGTALKIMGAGSWETMGKSMATLAGSLLILAGALAIMDTSIPGAIALGIVAGGLVVLAVAMKLLATLSWTDLVKGLVALAGALTIIGVASLVLAPLVPVIFALSAALIAFGAAIALIGAGVALFGIGFAALATAMAGGAAAITAALALVISKIPAFMEAFAKGVIGMAKVFIDAIPMFVDGIGKLIEALLNQIIKLAPKFGQALIVVIHTGLKVIRETIPDFVQTGIDLIISMFNGIANNAGKLVDSANRAAKAVIKALGKALVQDAGDFVGWAWQAMQGLWDALWKAIDGAWDGLTKMGVKIAKAIASGLSSAIGDVLSKIGSGILDNLSPAAWAKSLQGALNNIANIGTGTPLKKAKEAGVTLGKGISDSLTAEVGRQANYRQAALNIQGAIDSAIAASSMNLNPTITPVIDLTDVHAKAAQMNDILGKTSIVSKATATSGKAISQALLESGQNGVNPSVGDNITNISLTQNNTSPKSLDAITLYRQTNSQLALAKEALKA